MPPLVRAGLAAALLATLAVMTDRPPRSVRVGTAAPSGESRARFSALCPRGTLPDGEVCVPVPPRGPAPAEASPGRARTEHDRIERRPDRPADPAKYRSPLDGAVVRLVRLEHQEGDSEVLYVGELEGFAGRTVVTLHPVRDSGGLREYLAIFSNLARVEPGIARGKTLHDGDKLGAVGAGTSAEKPPLDYEIRRLRAGVAARSLDAGDGDFVADARTVGCDPRNVVPLR